MRRLPPLDASPGWHQFDETLTPAAGTEADLFLYADGDRGRRRATETEYRGFTVAARAPDVGLAVRPLARLPEISYRRTAPGEFRVRVPARIIRWYSSQRKRSRPDGKSRPRDATPATSRIFVSTGTPTDGASRRRDRTSHDLLPSRAVRSGGPQVRSRGHSPRRARALSSAIARAAQKPLAAAGGAQEAVRAGRGGRARKTRSFKGTHRRTERTPKQRWPLDTIKGPRSIWCRIRRLAPRGGLGACSKTSSGLSVEKCERT